MFFAIDHAMESISPSPPRTIIVLGMHRSGTSALTGSFEEAGVYWERCSYGTATTQKAIVSTAR